ncbi:hypothetical protein Tco_0063566 [Tanacetum coccineum]
MTRCIMKARDIAVRHATYIVNRKPTRALVGVTPYEKFYGEKPNLEDLKAESSTQTGKEEDTFTVLWNDTKGAEFQQPLNENSTNGPDVQEQPTHDKPQITIPGQNAHLYNPQTPTNEDDYEDDDVAIPVEVVIQDQKKRGWFNYEVQSAFSC